MADLHLDDLPKSPTTQMFVGAVSPLWGYFGAAAAGGVAYWWMTRWTRPMNLEALFEAAAQASPLALTAAAEEMVEAVAEAAVEAAESVLEGAPGPVGGEAAPMSPLVAVEASSPPETESPAQPIADVEPEPAPKAKKAAPPKADS